MQKTPDEIMKGLVCCKPIWKNDHWKTCDRNCPYVAEAVHCRTMLNGDALALIQQLEARVPRWISVEERLPEHMDDVLVWVGGLAEIGCHDENDDCWELYTYVGDGTVTHWMPLPKPPKEEQQ